jgi:hypothetical protein
METVLDFEKDIRVDLRNPKLMHAHAIEAHKVGLYHIAKQVRQEEQRQIDGNNESSAGAEIIEDFGYFHPVVYCSFNWFAISLTSYLRLVALVDLVNRTGWSLADLVAKEKEVSKTCHDFTEEVAPAVLRWRNKVAAHPAVTAPIGKSDARRPSDRLGTLLQSFSCPVSRTAGYFEVGRAVWEIDGERADLLPWSITGTYERLTSRFWPEASIPPHRHRPGEEPIDEWGTYLRSARIAR